LGPDVGEDFALAEVLPTKPSRAATTLPRSSRIGWVSGSGRAHLGRSELGSAAERT